MSPYVDIRTLSNPVPLLQELKASSSILTISVDMTILAALQQDLQTAGSPTKYTEEYFNARTNTFYCKIQQISKSRTVESKYSNRS